MGYSNEELQMMGDDGNVDGCQGQDFWQSRAIPMDQLSGGLINTAEIVRPVRQDQSLGDPFPLEAIVRQTTNDGSHFVGEQFVGAAFVGEDGSVYGVDDMGFISKIKRGARGMVRKAGGAVKSTASFAKKTVTRPGAALKDAGQFAKKYGTKAAYAATYVQRQALHGATWAAFAPVRLTVNQILSGIVRGAAQRGKRLTAQQAKLNLYASMSKSRNPVIRGGVALLKEFGPGTSPKVRITGDELDGIGAAPAAGAVAALNAALIAAKGVLIKAAVAAAAGAATKLAARTFGPGESEPRPEPMPTQIPAEERPEPEAMAVTPSDAQVDNALDPEPTDESSGWEAGCCV